MAAAGRRRAVAGNTGVFGKLDAAIEIIFVFERPARS
jgi:hypothetical protein